MTVGYTEAQRIADDLLRDAANGEEVTFQTQGEMNYDHHHPGQTSGQTHVDGWKAVKESDGRVRVTKIHSN